MSLAIPTVRDDDWLLGDAIAQRACPIACRGETGAIAALVHDSQMVHVDLDGCLAIELRPHPVAERFLDAFRDRYASLGSW